MPDSARSMEVDDKDVVLMTNGTDRFAGKILGMEGTDIDPLRKPPRHDSPALCGNRRNPLRPLPVGQIKKPEGPSHSILGPVGRISAKSIVGDDKLLKLEHAILGPVDLHTDPVIMIEYKSGTRIADEWNEDL